MIKKILLLIYGLFSLFWLQAQSPGGVSTNLQRWYRADGTTTVVSGAVSQWNDMTANNVHLTQATAANRPAQNTSSNLINFNPSLSFDGTNDNLRNTAGAAFITGSGGYTAYYVASSGGSASRYVIGLGASASANGFNSGTAATATSKTSGGTAFVTVAGTWSSTPSITRTGFNGGATQPYYLSSNSSAESTSANATPNVAANAPLTIGARPDGTANYWNGAVSEVIWYSGKHAAADFNRIESYLAVKYGITKAGNYINSASTTVWTSGGGYDNNIAGIARDDMGGAASSGLNQKQSQSQNTGNQVILGIGDIVTTTNAAHTGSFASTAQYLVWGDNNTAGTTTFSSAPYTNRLQRVWRVQNTGSVNQDIRVLIPVALLGQNQSGALLYSTSSTFASGNQLYINKGISSLAGTSYYVFTIPAAQASQAVFYFTVAYYQQSPGGVSGANLWLRADAGTSTTTDAATLSTWTDQSGQRTNLATTSSGLQTFKNNAADNINFNPAVYFDGLGGLNFGNDYIFTPAGNGGVTLFAAAAPDNTAATKSAQFLYDFGFTQNEDYRLIYSSTNSAIGTPIDFGGVETVTTQSNGIIPSIIGGQINFGSNQFLFNNGLQYGTNAITLAALTATQIAEAANHIGTGGPVSIGRQAKSAQFTNNDTRAYQGHLGEMIHFSDNLTDIQRQRVNSYLAMKYGITLTRDNDNDSTPGETLSGSVLEGDYVASDGTTRVWNSDAVYQNNIAGVGRDDTSGLLQKQSQSMNAGYQLAFSLGNMQSTNNVNTSNFFFDKVFFMWGDDAGSLDATTATGNASYAYRFARVWKTQNTNNLNQLVNLYFPVAAFGNAPASSVYLLYGTTAASLSNGTAAAILQSGTLSINGVNNYVFLVSAAALANMQFFSFAANITYPGGVTGEALWLRADAGTSTTTNGAALSQWNDQSLNVNNVTQATAANQPTYRNNTTDNVNFNPVVRFDGTNDRLNGAADILPDNSQQLSFSGVYRSSAATGNILASSNITNGPDDGLIISTGVADAVINRSNSLFVLAGDGSINTNNFISSGSSSFPANTLTLSSFVKTGATTGVIYSRGTALATTGSINNPMSFSNQTTQLVIGSGTDTDVTYSPFFNGIMGDIIVYGANLTAAQRLRVESYLAIKYGVTLDQSTVLNFNNGDFSSGDLGYWNSSGNVQAFSNTAAFNGSNTTPNGVISQQISTVNGQTYTFAGDVIRVGAGAGTVRLRLDIIDDVTSAVIATQNLTAVSGTASFTQAFTGNGNNFSIKFTDVSSVTTNVDISVDNLTLSPNASTTGTNYLNSVSGIIWNATANAAYNKNIAGIGRDDLSALYQKQSQSVNTGSQVIMALGTAAASNLANANTIAADKQFFIWGDDNGSLTTQVLTGNNTYTYRFTRIWKTQNTGAFAENMTVYYPITAFGNALPATVALLYGTTAASLSNGTASAIAQSGTTTINGASYYVFTVPSAQVSSMQFFSFAGPLTAPGGVTSGLKIWHKADADVTAASNLVTAWTNQVDNIQAVNSGGTERPTLGNGTSTLFNFNDYLNFTSNTNSLQNTNSFLISSGDGSLSVFSSIRITANGQLFGINNTPALTGATSYDNFQWFGNLVNQVVPAVNITYSPTQVNAGQSILSFTHDGAANQFNAFNNLTSIGSSASATQSPGTGGYVLGNDSFDGGNDVSFVGQLSEHIAYDRVLSASEIQRVRTYLAVKTGITLNQNHLLSDGTTNVWNTTTNSGYNNNIAGIGRDDISGLTQKQSTSINTGTSQVIVALGTIAATNQANANTIPTDKQFFIWGDDNGSLTTQVLTGNNTYTYRFTRVWKTQNTGSFSQNITVYYPVSAFGNALPSTIALLYGTTAASLSNGTASSIAQSGTTTINSVSYYAFTVPSAQVANMQFFSFAGTQTSPGGVLTNLSRWYRADSGASVSNWVDQTSNANATQVTVANQPTLNTAGSSLINFNPSLTFNSSQSDYMTFSDAGMPSGNNARSSFGVARTSVLGGTFEWITGYGTGSSTNHYGLMRTGNNILVTSYLNDFVPYGSDNPYGNNTPVLSYGAASGSTLFGTYNALPIQSGTFTVNTILNTGRIGTRQNLGEYWNGLISEVIYYNMIPSALEKQRIDSYLGLKYGTSLGSISSPFTYLASDGITVAWTGNATYQNNIAGIGRDDLSALYQKQSQSVNSGSQVVMSLGTVAASNQANANTIATDKQFFIWGDDNGSLTNVVATGNSTYLYRFTRVWKTQNTGTFAENMTMYYPVSAFGNALPATVALLYGTTAASLSNGTASAIAQSGTTTINGVSFYAFTVPSAQVANMQFFSFAGTQTAPGGVTGEALWLKADAGTSTTTDGVGVQNWNDQSGNSNNSSQATSASRPLYSGAVMNFNPGLDMNGKSIGGAAGFNGTDYFDVFRLRTTVNSSSSERLIEWNLNTGNDDANIRYTDLGSATGYFAGEVVTESLGDGTVSTSRYRIGVSNTLIPSFAAQSHMINARRNLGNTNIEFGYNARTYTADLIHNTLAAASINEDYSITNADLFQGEIISYPARLTDLERLRVSSYLGIKYGLTLSRDNNGNGTSGQTISGSVIEGDYVASNGTTRIWNSDATYLNNIAGIGRDDISALYQKQSQSVNGGSQVVMALGTAAANNQANANTIATDKQFFIWGDDNGSITSIVSTGNGTYSYRLTRIWKAQNTGSFAENITVYYPVAAFGSAPASTVALLYGTSAASLSNGTASAIAQGGTTTINGTSYYAFTVPSAQVANMQFFSFTGTQTAPGGVSGSLLWARADAGVSTSGTNVTGWQNQSDSANNFIPDGTPVVVSAGINFNDLVRFNGSSSLYTSNVVLPANSNYSRFVMFKINNTGFANIMGSGNPSNAGRLSFWKPGAGSTVSQWTNGNFGNTANISTSIPQLGTSIYEAGVSNGTYIKIGGVQNTASTNTITYLASPLRLAANTSVSLVGDFYMDGDIPEAIAYASALSAVNVRQVESYLAVKYGATLGTTGSTVSYLASDGVTTTWTGSATYQNNIAGIGRDDLSALYQKQSQSVNTGSQVVMALGTAAASNQANANTIAIDKQFFIWGDDNGSLSNVVATGNTTYPYRFTRVWKTQNTGSFAENMTVYYPVSAFGNASASTVALLYGTTAASLSNGTASAIAQSSTTTINGASYYAFTIPSAQVANMQFFSFAGTQTAPGGVSSELWLKADLGTSSTVNGSGISQWNDQSGNTNNVAQGTAGNQPSYFNSASQLVNFNPVVKFDGVDDELINNAVPASVSTDNTLEVVAVGFTTGTTLQAISHHGPATNNSQVEFLMNGATDIILRENCSSCSNSAATYTAITGGIPNIVGFNLANGTTNLNALNVYNNLRALSSPTASVSGAADITSTTLIVGARRDNLDVRQNPFNGSIPEYIVFQQPLSSIERARVYSYTAIKYGVTLDQTTATNYLASDGTTILWNGTSNAAYNKNIAAIGRDDLSALYQKQSQSQNTGSQVVMALGTVAASNQANAGTIPTDKQFFIWGDDNGSLSTFVSTGNITYPSRFTRIWKTQNTGTFAENMTVYYPVSAFGTSLAAYVGMIYGSSAASLSNGSASVIAQSGTTTINGISYYVFTVPSAQVGGMQFFSFTGNSICYKPGVTVGTTLDAKHGITALNRAGTAGDNWPMVRKGAWTVLESKTKGFVINRLTAAQIAAIPGANLVEGMMIYDTTNNCMKVYTSTDGGTTFGWQCITTQTCPD